MATNPLLAEINGAMANLSPAAQEAVRRSGVVGPGGAAPAAGGTPMVSGGLNAPPTLLSKPQTSPSALLTPSKATDAPATPMTMPQPGKSSVVPPLMPPTGGNVPRGTLDTSIQRTPGILSTPADKAPTMPSLTMGSLAPSILSAGVASVPPMVTAPRGTVQGDENEFGRLLNDKPGIDQVKNNTGRHFLQVLDTIGSTLLPRVAANIPGTTAHHEQLLTRAANDLGASEKTDLEQAQSGAQRATAAHENEETAEMPGAAADEAELRRAQGDEAEARAYVATHPQVKTAFDLWHQQNPNAPATEFLKAQAAAKPGNDFEQYYADYLKAGGPGGTAMQDTAANRLAARKDFAAAGQTPQRMPVDEGSWLPAEDGKGNPIFYNSKTMKTRSADGSEAAPGGVYKEGTHAKSTAGDQASTAALTFANNYLKTGAFTGPSDEALQDQFFQLAKPSTGFRMNQAQIDQLHSMTSWVNSLRGRAYHMATGTWFAPEQRQQIVQTMNDLAKSKGLQLPGEGAGAGASGNSAAPKDGDVKTNSAGDKVKFSGGKWGPA